MVQHMIHTKWDLNELQIAHVELIDNLRWSKIGILASEIVLAIDALANPSYGRELM